MKLKSLCTLFAFFGLVTGVFAGATGSIIGTVKDAQSGEGLPGANVIIEGTALGAATNLDGEYRIERVPPGKYTLVVSFIGYQKLEHLLSVASDEMTRYDAKLRFEAVETKEVVVTAQLEGQVRAINQQLASNTIVNVVSQDKIQELPDQNAAESLGRLPGIAVERDAGEGQKVVVRGLAPKFNSITVNGERIPATDPENRSVDLSMISPDVLAGIEVFKALTPDKDADAVGGTINFVVRKAPDRLQATFRGQSGYNDHEQEFGQYKSSLSLSNRFFNDRLGFVATGSLQRADRSSDVLDAEYLFKREAREGEERAKIEVAKLNLADRLETRDRYSGSLTLDYDLKDMGGILLSSFWGRTNRDELRRRKRYRVDAGRTEYELRDREINTTLLTNSLGGQHTFRNLRVDWRGSFSKTIREVPFEHLTRFQELAAFNNGLIDDQGPSLIPAGAKNNVDETWFQFATMNTEQVTDRNITGQMDFELPIGLGRDVAGYIKFGGKVRDKNRNRDRNELRTPFGAIDEIGAADAEKFNLIRDGESVHILFNNFVDPNFEAQGFLNSQYQFGPGLDRGLINDFWLTYQDRYDTNRVILLDNYDAGETISAGYFMAEINLGQKVMLLPGVRFEHAVNNYDANVGELLGDLGQNGSIIDSTGGQNYSEFLPMVHLRYKLSSKFDVRFAVTRTLSRPDYFNLVPFENINRSEQILIRGNPNLRHMTAWNYDTFFSFYNNRLGLFTLGLFYKKLYDIDYIRQTRIITGEFSGYSLTEPVNGEGSTVHGFEVDLQTNLRFLPSPLDGIILNANYSLTQSETFFPFFEIGPRSTEPPYRPTVIDTVREGKLPGQAKHIANLSIGYEKRGFSGRVSMQFQDKSLLTVGSRPELDGFTDVYVRWDVALSQSVTRRLSLFFNFNNFTNQPEGAFLGLEAFPTHEEYFGWTSDLGIRYRF